MKKRAQIQIQFNWIYVAVVGAIILLVFFNIAFGIRKSARQQLERDAINYFDEIFTSLQGSENTEQSIGLPDLEINFEMPFETDTDICNHYSIGNSELGRRSTQFVPIFSPDSVKKKVLSYSLAWDVPFRANYFLYLSSPEIAYVFLGNDVMINDLIEDLPNHLTKIKEDNALGFKDQNYYKIRFITFLDPNTLLANVHGSVRSHDDVDVLWIKPNSDLYDFGEVTYYELKKGNLELIGSANYFDKATLFASFYSQTHLSYKCNLKKAIIRMSKVAELLVSRNNIIKESDNKPQCLESYYDDSSSLFNQLISTTSSGEINSALINNIFNIKIQLRSLNNEIISKSCTEIY